MPTRYRESQFLVLKSLSLFLFRFLVRLPARLKNMVVHFEGQYADCGVLPGVQIQPTMATSARYFFLGVGGV